MCFETKIYSLILLLSLIHFFWIALHALPFTVKNKRTPPNVEFLFLFQRKEFVKYAKVFPLSETFDFKVPSKWYRRAVGILEIACGIAMAFVPSRKYQNILYICYLFFSKNQITLTVTHEIQQPEPITHTHVS